MCVASSLKLQQRKNCIHVTRSPIWKWVTRCFNSSEMCYPSVLVVYFYSLQALLFTGVCVCMSLCVYFIPARGEERGVHQIIHQNKSVANSILHTECPVWPCMTPEHTVHTCSQRQRSAWMEKTPWLQTGGKRDWRLKNRDEEAFVSVNGGQIKLTGQLTKTSSKSQDHCAKPYFTPLLLRATLQDSKISTCKYCMNRSLLCTHLQRVLSVTLPIWKS